MSVLIGTPIYFLALPLVHQLSMRRTRAKRAPPAIPATSIMDAPFRLSATELKALCADRNKIKSPSGLRDKKSEREGGWLFIWNVAPIVFGLTGMSVAAMALRFTWVRSLEAILSRKVEDNDNEHAWPSQIDIVSGASSAYRSKYPALRTLGMRMK